MNRYLVINSKKLYDTLSGEFLSTQQTVMLFLLDYAGTNGQEPSEHKYGADVLAAWEKVKGCLSWGEVIPESDTAKNEFLETFQNIRKAQKAKADAQAGKILLSGKGEFVNRFNSLNPEQQKAFLNSIPNFNK